MREIESSNLSNKEKMIKVKEIKVLLNGIQKNAVKNLPEYQENLKTIKSSEKEFDKQVAEVYREANKETFGAEYAIKTHNKDTYEKSSKS